MELSKRDRDLAKEVGFDEKALAIVKDATGSEFHKVELNNYETDDADTSRQPVDHRPKITGEDLERFRKMGDTYPELKASVEKWITDFQRPTSMYQRIWTEAQQARFLEIQQKTKPFSPYIQQDYDALKKELGLKGNQFVTFADERQKQDLTPDEIAKALAAKYANKPLAEKYKPFSGLEFYIPVAGWDPQVMPKVVPSSQGLGNFLMMQDTTKTITQLQKQLKDFGYTVVAKEPRESSDIFDNKDAAIAFANSRPKAPLEYVDIDEVQSLSHELEVDPAELGGGASVIFTPHQDFVKVGPNKWRFTNKPMYTVRSLLLRAVLLKSASVSASEKSESNKFAFVRAANTQGINYGVDNDMIVEKLEEWDRRYGVNVIEAKFDRLVIEFKTLPDDLSYLCTEMWLFCPDLLDVHDDYLLTASAMREFATHLRQNRQVSFWWD